MKTSHSTIKLAMPSAFQAPMGLAHSSCPEGARKPQRKESSLMKATKQLAVGMIAAWFGAMAIPAEASSLIFSQLNDGQSTFGPSEVWAASNIDSEVSDDFDVVGNI